MRKPISVNASVTLSSMVKYVLLEVIGNTGLTKDLTHTSRTSTFPLALREIRTDRFSTSHFSEAKYETKQET
jgi:hypothetical protein